MAFWIAIAVLTAAVTIALLAPIYRTRSGASSREAEIAIYRDQLDEIDRDVARGVLPDTEARSARNEIARRLLKAGAETSDSKTGSTSGYRGIVIAAVMAVPILSVGLYVALGMPNLPDRPIAERRADTDPADVAMVMNAVEAYFGDPNRTDPTAIGALVDAALVANPDQPALWQAGTVIFLEQRRFDDVVAAYGRFVALGGREADPDGNVALYLGDQMTGLAGAILPQAEELFARALEANPANLSARFYIALALTERGDTAAAIAAWQSIVDTAPPDAAALSNVAREQLAALGVEVAPPEPAAAQTPEQQLGPIVQMVEGLAARLATEQGTTAEWARLILSYLVLDRPDDAVAAVTNARAAFAATPEAMAEIEEAVLSPTTAIIAGGSAGVDIWVRLIRSYDVLGRLDEAQQAIADGRLAFAGNAEALAVIDEAAQEVEQR